MTETSMAAMEHLRKGEEPERDWLREAVRSMVQELMEAEVGAQIGAGRYERTDDRTAHRNGYRSRPWDTRLGSMELAIPKPRQGSYFPSDLSPRRRAEQAGSAANPESDSERVARGLGCHSVCRSVAEFSHCRPTEARDRWSSRRIRPGNATRGEVPQRPCQQRTG